MYKSTSYVSEFFNLNCSKDILNIYETLPRNFEKEISEAMAILHKVDKVCRVRDKYAVLDLCAGNGLAGLLVQFVLKPDCTLAFDINVRKMNIGFINNYGYLKQDITKPFNEWKHSRITKFDNVVIISCHPCKNIAYSVIDRFKEFPCNNKHLILSPCCRGNPRGALIPQIIHEKLGRYLAWSYQLSQYAEANLTVDRRCLSPCNAIIYK